MCQGRDNQSSFSGVSGHNFEPFASRVTYAKRNYVATNLHNCNLTDLKIAVCYTLKAELLSNLPA